MRHTRILIFLAVAATALLAFGSSASATSVSSTTGGSAETLTIHIVNEGGHIIITTPIGTIECSSTAHVVVTSHGPGVSVSGHILTLTATGCTNSWTVETNAAGTLSVTSTSGHNGTLSSSGATITGSRHTIFGTVECRYSTNATHIGTISGGNPATLHIEGSIPFHSGGGLCGSGNSQWSGNYVTTSALYVAP